MGINQPRPHRGRLGKAKITCGLFAQALSHGAAGQDNLLADNAALIGEQILKTDPCEKIPRPGPVRARARYIGVKSPFADRGAERAARVTAGFPAQPVGQIKGKTKI